MKKLLTPNEIIQSVIDVTPIITYKSTEQEIKDIQQTIYDLLSKSYIKTHEIISTISGADSKPPFSLSWELKPKVKRKKV